MNAIQLESSLTCPHCGHVQRERMPEDACLFFWECPACKSIVRPRPDDCCVFCSWGDAACPPVQRDGRCNG